MGFKRFVAATTKDAMTQVRRALGDDAVILSNKRAASGNIEILAAASSAVEAIVEDARKPGRAAPASVQIAPGVRRVGPPVQSFQEYLRRQPQAASASRKPAPATIGGASMYRAVAAARTSDDELDWNTGGDDSGWANSRFDPSLMTGTRNPEPVATQSSAVGTRGNRSLPAAPAIDTWLPNSARSAPSAAAVAPGRAGFPAAGAAPAHVAVAPEDEPAVFRRRPSRELQAATAAAQPMHPTRPAATARPTLQTASPAALQPQPSPGPVQHMAPPVVATAAVTPQPAVAVHSTLAPLAVATPTVHGANATAAPVIEPLPTAVHAPAQLAAEAAQPAPVVTAVPRTEIRLPAPAPESVNAALMAELASLRASLQQQLSSLSNTVVATDAMRRNPMQTRVMTRLLTSGFSVDVARKVALNAPELGGADAADAWMQDVLAHNLRCGGAEDSLVERGGAYALVGPTGVGKTTTVAKLAARFAVKHGTSALGLITLDAYRVAAPEQLRTFGRILGAPVHLAQDGATLRELLASMKGKRLVLIDTCGLGPRDDRLPEMLGVLAQAGQGLQPVQPVLLLNAASHAETLDDSARAWRAHEAAGAILTKLDEAARIGGALDCALRHKLKLLGLTNGQRVPEDLHLPNARLLAHLALKPSNQLFSLAEDEGMALAHHSAVHGIAAHA